MITEKEMQNAVNKKAKLVYVSGETRIGIIEEFHHAQDEDEEPMILYTPKLAAYQSELEKIEIIEK